MADYFHGTTVQPDGISWGEGNGSNGGTDSIDSVKSSDDTPPPLSRMNMNDGGGMIHDPSWQHSDLLVKLQNMQPAGRRPPGSGAQQGGDFEPLGKPGRPGEMDSPMDQGGQIATNEYMGKRGIQADTHEQSFARRAHGAMSGHTGYMSENVSGEYCFGASNSMDDGDEQLHKRKMADRDTAGEHMVDYPGFHAIPNVEPGEDPVGTYRKTIMALGRENYFLKQQFGIANGQVLTLGRDLSSATEELHRLRMLVASLEQRHGMSAEQLAGLGQASVHDREMSSMQHEFEMASMHSRRGQREMPAAHLRMYPGYSGAFPQDSMSSGYSGAFLQDSMSSCSPLSMSEHSYNGFGTSSLTSSMASSPLDPSRATPPGISSLDAAARRRKKGRVNRAAAAARSAAAAATSKNGNHSGRNRLSGESNSGSGESDATDVANGIAENKDSGKDGRGQEASDKSEKSEQGSGADETSSGTRSKGATKEEEPKPRFWTAEEHARFLEAVRIHGFGNARAIAAFVGTRNITQVRTHAQKYILKLSRMRGKNGVAGATGHKPSGSGTSEVATPVLREDADQSLSFLGGEREEEAFGFAFQGKPMDGKSHLLVAPMLSSVQTGANPCLLGRPGETIVPSRVWY